MKELFTEFLSKEYKTVTEWETFYTANGGVDRIERATDKLHSMLNKMPVDHAIFSRDLAKNYIIDLVIYKTHFGMSGEYYAVLATAKHYNMALRWSNAAEESQGIDAWLDNFPVQVKPHDSHKVNHVRNHADTTKTLVITYESKKDVCYVHNPEFINK